MMGFNIWTKVMLVSLPKKFPSRQGQLTQFRSKLSNLTFHDSLARIFLKFCGIMGHNTQTKVTLVNFPKKNSFWGNMGPIWPKITQLVLTAQKIFRDMLTQWSPTLLILVNFPRKFPFLARCNLCKNMQPYDLLSQYFLEIMQHDGI